MFLMLMFIFDVEFFFDDEEFSCSFGLGVLSIGDFWNFILILI